MPSNPTQRVTTKKRVNLTASAELVETARELDINLSATLEAALEVAVREARARAWKRENAAALSALNGYVARNGRFSDTRRRF